MGSLGIKGNISDPIILIILIIGTETVPIEIPIKADAIKNKTARQYANNLLFKKFP